ncbi:SusC/RagA family TonB-linked outer membrane protein [Carboxylicivirga sp. RSCT41]|uniref:SusC/RagA family TonB-linked outer membrane protein n=1 Tax=Carboxylicivirga agarovorans TaxID=3417570 RepID=UPI003D35811A
MKRLKLLLVALLLCNVTGMFAQSLSVSGKVTDDTGSGVPGVNILIKGTQKGVISDMDGNYVIDNVSVDDVLVFSFIGLETQEIKITNTNTSGGLNIVMVSGSIGLDEVIAVGYGTRKKSSLTAAISSVGEKDIEKTQNLRVEQALQGRTAGVTVTSSSAQPGAGMSVRIRGAGTNGNSDPLYIVDGLPVGGIDYLNPGDIASMEILKDAASSSIYGARGANGVVLITTKKGKAQTFTVSYDGYHSIQNPERKLSLMDADQYVLFYNEAQLNDGVRPMDFNRRANTDWQDEIYNKNAPMMNHSVTLNGGTEKAKISSGISYFGQEGLVAPDNSNYSRITARVNAETKSHNDKLRTGTSLYYSNIESSGISVNNIYGGPLASAYNLDPLTPVRDENGEYGVSEYVSQGITNPVGKMEYLHSQTRTDKFVGNMFVEYSFLKNLKFKSSYGIDLAYVTWEDYNPVYKLSPSDYNLVDDVQKSMTRYFNHNWENVITYDLDLNKHSINAVAGSTILEETSHSLWGSGVDITKTPKGEDYAYIDNTISDKETRNSSGGKGIPNRLVSFFSRVNYDFNEKYFFSATFRADGSSRFGPDNKYGYFPSLSGGWVLTNENFAASLKGFTNFIKLRASWGQNGSNHIGNFVYVSNISDAGAYVIGNPLTSGTSMQGLAPNTIPTPDIRWETSEQTDIGLDAHFFDSKITFTFDYYNKLTKDLLLAVKIPGHYGSNSPIDNAAEVRNRGYEFEFGYNNKSASFNWGVNANISFNDNEVTYIGNDEKVLGGATVQTYGMVTRAEEGEPLGYFWGYETDGLFQNQTDIDNMPVSVNENGDIVKMLPDAQPGDVRFIDQNGDGILDDNDKINLGNSNPVYFYGLSLFADWKGFDVSVFMQGAGGHQIANLSRRLDAGLTNLPETMLNRWTGENSTNSEPRASIEDPNKNYSRFSDRYVVDADYLRVKNVQLGYTFSKTALSRLKIEHLKLYVAAQNLYTFTDYPGVDVEFGSGTINSGVDTGTYPQARTFTVGMNLRF